MSAASLLLAVQLFFLGYFVLLNGSYLLLNLVSLVSLRRYMRRYAEFGADPPSLGIEPPISLIVPAFNEAATIRTSVRSMLQLQYPEFELVVVNDGSTDRTLEILTDEFELVPHPEVVRLAVGHQPIRGVYRSLRQPSLRVVDKVNGGSKADALNAGINVSRHGLFCAVDADSILQRDSLLRLVQPFIEDERTVAAGGTVRIANGSVVRGGFLVRARLPRNLLALMQIVEYLRAFLGGRLGWSPINGVLIISGAFGLFDRARVEAAGGYRPDAIGEDMELILRLHRWHRERRLPYRIPYVPDPICWTEAPEDLDSLGRQRTRWQRGLIQSLLLHPPTAFGWRAGAAGWLAWPFMLVFEWFGPVIELAGYVFMIVGTLLGQVSPAALAVFLLLAVGVGILLSVNGLLLETLSLRLYARRREILLLFAMALLENLGYRQLSTFWRCRGIWQWLRGHQHQWGVVKRSGRWGEH